MSNLARITQSQFGSAAPGSGVGSINVFGSFAAGNTTISTNPGTIQSLAAWAGGWLSAIVGQNGPVLEDMNGIFYVITYQLAYLFQKGVPEWDAGTTYYAGALVNSAGTLYVSLQNANTDNALTATAYWKPQGGGVRTIASGTTDAGLASDDLVLVSVTGNSITCTLPLGTSVAFGKKITYKALAIVDTGWNYTLAANPSDITPLIDGASTYLVDVANDATYPSVTVQWTGSQWVTI